MGVLRSACAALLLALGACSSATQKPAPFDLVGVGLAGRTDGEGARAGMTFAYWTAGYRGFGSFAKLRVDAATGLELLFNGADRNDSVDEHRYLDDHIGAVVFDAGLVYRFADNFAVYGGLGLGNLYEYSATQTASGRVDSTVHALEWEPNLTTGLLWMWGASGAGLDLGYDSFDRSLRFGFVINYAGTGGNWLD